MSLEPNVWGDHPRIDATACVHPTAVIIGNVRIGPRTHICPHAVLRADEPGPRGNVEPILIEAEVNVQDGAVVHALGGTGVTVGRGTSLAHGVIVHGPCEIGSRCFVGFGSVVYDAVLGEGVVVMHRALVEGVSVPKGLQVPSMTSVRGEDDVYHLRPASREVLEFVERVRLTNVSLAEARG